MKNDNEAASWWMENYIYCCSQSCNDWLSSIGSALGYESYIEGGIALLVIMLYLAMFESERRRLNLSAKGIYDIAFATQPAATEATAGASTAAGADSTAADGQKDSHDNMATATEQEQQKGLRGSGYGSSAYNNSRGEAALPSRLGVVQVSAWQDE